MDFCKVKGLLCGHMEPKLSVVPIGIKLDESRNALKRVCINIASRLQIRMRECTVNSAMQSYGACEKFVR